MITIPKEVFTYNAEVLYFGCDLIHIKEAFKNQFDYEAVMLPATVAQQSQWEF